MTTAMFKTIKEHIKKCILSCEEVKTQNMYINKEDAQNSCD